MILSCVKRIGDKIGYNVGINLIGNVLRGSKLKRITELELDTLSTYGLLKDRTRSEIHAMIHHLEAEGFLVSDYEFQTISLTPQASGILYLGKTITMKVEVEPEEKIAPVVTAKLAGREADLFDELKELRGKLAREAGVPAYVVFSNATLTDMAKKKPLTMSQFRKVSGVGEIKAAWYGEAFIKCIRSFHEENEG